MTMDLKPFTIRLHTGFDHITDPEELRGYEDVAIKSRTEEMAVAIADKRYPEADWIEVIE